MILVPPILAEISIIILAHTSDRGGNFQDLWVDVLDLCVKSPLEDFGVITIDDVAFRYTLNCQ